MTPDVIILCDSKSEHNSNSLTASNDISVDDILDMLSAMNGGQGYVEMLEAWAAWDALSRSADEAMRARMLEACRQFAQNRASVLRNGAA